LLLAGGGRVQAHEQLLEQVWDYDFAEDTCTVYRAVKRLRAKLQKTSFDADCIRAVHGAPWSMLRSWLDPPSNSP
jgi:DNA-binding response OmpR family regulator